MTDPKHLEHIKHAPASTGVEDIILKRWSPRAFTTQPVSDGDLKKIFLAASWAASSSNEQPWRFILGRNGDETFQKIFSTLAEPNQAWAKTAPVLVLSAGKKTFTSNQQPNHYVLHDTGAASANMCLEAIALGIHTHGMGGFDREKARAALSIPDGFEVGACWAMGYLGDPETLSIEYQKRGETEPRTRKPLGEFLFSEWEKPLTL